MTVKTSPLPIKPLTPKEKAVLEFIEKQKDSAAVIFFKGGGAQFSKRATQYIRNT